MAKQSKHYYDISKHISLPMALTAAVIVVVILLFLGMKYSAFEGGLLSAQLKPIKPAPTALPSAGIDKCIAEHNKCVKDAIDAYDECRTDAGKALIACLGRITERDPVLRERARAQCEVDSSVDVSNCTVTFSTDISTCAPAMRECLEDYYRNKGTTLPQPSPLQPIQPTRTLPGLRPQY